MSDCIFCKIANGDVPAEIVYKSDNVIGFKDLSPVAPIHYLFIPKKHYASLDEIPKEDIGVIGDIMNAVAETARKEGISKNGYRVITNTNKDAGQVIFHLHVHLLGGRVLGKMG